MFYTIISIVYTCLLVLLLIPYIFIFKSLNLPLSVDTFLRLYKLAVSRYRHKHQNHNNDIREERDNEVTVEGEISLPKGLRRELMPRHVAVIVDGNRRWAENAGLMTSQGHEIGIERVYDFIQICFNMGIDTVSVYSFSTENWGRQKFEVDCLMLLFEQYIISKLQFFHRENVRVSIIGCHERIPESFRRTIKKIEEATKSYKKKHFIIAVDYSGRFDITNACKNIVKKTEQGLINEEDVDEKLIESELLTKCSEFPNPDLLIRTSGEQRISNFFLWQLAYTELFFSPVLWPDFDKDCFIDALVSYQQRERRFGANA